MTGANLRIRESLTPEEKAARKKTVLRKFRVIVHLVMANRYWLGEMEDVKITDNVRRNIRLLLRKKKILSTLTLKEKSIMSKPKEMRTEEEKAHLNKLISGLKVFRRYPPETKRQLAACTYFVYYPPDRDIIRQDQPGLAMYFILSGEVTVTSRHYDKYLDEYVVEESGILGPGQTFGEVSLLHDEGRLATVTTKTDCEFLMIMREDFKAVVQETVEKTWNEIMSVFDSFSYFKHWDRITKRETSVLTKTKHFAPDDTILGDDAGFKECVYFITKGTCCVIENLSVTVFCVQGIETYTLTPIAEDDTISVNLATIFKKYKQYMVGDDDEVSIYSRISGISGMRRGSDISAISAVTEPRKRQDKKSIKSIKSEKSQRSGKSEKKEKTGKIIKSEKSIKSGKTRISEKSIKSDKKSSIKSDKSKSEKSTSGKSIEFQKSKTENDEMPNHSSKVVGRISIKAMKEEEGREPSVDSESIGSASSALITSFDYDRPTFGRYYSREEVHLIKVCEIHEGGCFNIGERLNRRRIVAVTPVSCLLIPRYWIMKYNKGNIWNMVQQYLNHTIPSSEAVFRKFVEKKKFSKYAKSLIRDILLEHNVLTGNSIHNVPYSIRLREGVDTEYFKF